MNFSEIEIFEIARLIKEEEKHFLEKVKNSLPSIEKISKEIENLILFYARQEKQKKREQKICNYIDNEETLAYLKEHFADILAFSKKEFTHAPAEEILFFWLDTHKKVLDFFDNLLHSTSDAVLQTDILVIREKEQEWRQTLQEEISPQK
ncbi:MAG: hypothetical protein ACK4TN_00085 [Brevinematales bacterium]